MSTVKVAVTIEEGLLRGLDREVSRGAFRNRSEAVRAAVEMLLERERGGSLLEALALIDPEEEKALAEEFLEGEAW